MEGDEVHRRCGRHVRGWDTSLLVRERSTQRVGGVAGSPAPNHINPMPRQQISPEAVDLFSFVQPSPTPRSGPPRPSAHQPTSPAKLASLSDAELAGLMKDLLGEVQRRTAGRALRQSRPELERAVRETASILARLQPKHVRPVAEGDAEDTRGARGQAQVDPGRASGRSEADAGGQALRRAADLCARGGERSCRS